MKKVFLALCGIFLLAACQPQVESPAPEPPANPVVEAPTEVEEPVEEPAEVEVMLDYLMDEAVVGTEIFQGYSVDTLEPVTFNSSGGGNIILMQKNALDQIYVNDEIIESFFSPQHPEDGNIVFLSTSKSTSDKYGPDMKVENRIYAYHLNSGEMNLLYEESEHRLLRTMGMDGSKLILMADGIDNSPGLCAPLWNENRSYVALELADVEGGLIPYTVPNYQLEIAKIEQVECEGDIFDEMGMVDPEDL